MFQKRMGKARPAAIPTGPFAAAGHRSRALSLGAHVGKAEKPSGLGAEGRGGGWGGPWGWGTPERCGPG